MKQILDQQPEVVEYAEKAIEAVGLPVRKSRIRGGTDGSKLSFMGLPCPNIFAGGMLFIALMSLSLCKTWKVLQRSS